MKQHEVEIWVLVDAEGDVEVGTSAELTRERYAENVGALDETLGFRLIKVTLTVPAPEVAEMVGEVPAFGTATLVLTEQKT